MLIILHVAIALCKHHISVTDTLLSYGCTEIDNMGSLSLYYFKTLTPLHSLLVDYDSWQQTNLILLSTSLSSALKCPAHKQRPRFDSQTQTPHACCWHWSLLRFMSIEASRAPRTYLPLNHNNADGPNALQLVSSAGTRRTEHVADELVQSLVGRILPTRFGHH